jgi:hypothetical protein
LHRDWIDKATFQRLQTPFLQPAPAPKIIEHLSFSSLTFFSLRKYVLILYKPRNVEQ